MSKKLATLYHKGSGGTMYQWKVWTEDALIHTQHGRVNGELQTSYKEAKPKNVGRANETTGAEQAVKEAAAMHKKKLDLKYSLTQEGAEKPLTLPMLAQSYDKRVDKIKWFNPELGHTDYHMMQPKLDGVRCTTRIEDGKIVHRSRTGKLWLTLDHISAELTSVLTDNVTLDGEIYHEGLARHIHGLDLPDEEKPSAFEVISALVKKHQEIEVYGFTINTTDLEYHVYDGFKEDYQWARFFLRNRLIKSTLEPHKEDRPHVRIVPTYFVNHREEVKELHDKFVSEGYEGAMLRLGGQGDKAGYRCGYRSPYLLKVKVFITEEFKIVDFTEGEGKDKGTVKWICVAPNGKTFTVRHTGALAHRKQLFENGQKYIGQWLMVKFFEWTGSGKPRFGVGLGIRLPEDMDTPI